MKILVINGPNLNLLGSREPELYGRKTYAELTEYIRGCCDAHKIDCEIFQSNHEGILIDKIQDAAGHTDGIVINAAAYTHTSLAIADAIKAVGLPAVEVHLTEPLEREDYRNFSYLTPVCKARFAGAGFDSYRLAIEYLAKNFG